MIIVVQFLLSVGWLCKLCRSQRQEWHHSLVILTLLLKLYIILELLLVLVQVHGSKIFLHQSHVVIIVIIIFVIDDTSMVRRHR